MRSQAVSTAGPLNHPPQVLLNAIGVEQDRRRRYVSLIGNAKPVAQRKTPCRKKDNASTPASDETPLAA
jgi:hypothetical protein